MLSRLSQDSLGGPIMSLDGNWTNTETRTMQPAQCMQWVCQDSCLGDKLVGLCSGYVYLPTAMSQSTAAAAPAFSHCLHHLPMLACPLLPPGPRHATEPAARRCLPVLDHWPRQHGSVTQPRVYQNPLGLHMCCSAGGVLRRPLELRGKGHI
jgi:hypothetical protein